MATTAAPTARHENVHGTRVSPAGVRGADVTWPVEEREQLSAEEVSPAFVRPALTTSTNAQGTATSACGVPANAATVSVAPSVLHPESLQHDGSARASARLPASAEQLLVRSAAADGEQHAGRLESVPSAAIISHAHAQHATGDKAAAPAHVRRHSLVGCCHAFSHAEMESDVEDAPRVRIVAGARRPSADAISGQPKPSDSVGAASITHSGVDGSDALPTSPSPPPPALARGTSEPTPAVLPAATAHVNAPALRTAAHHLQRDTSSFSVASAPVAHVTLRDASDAASSTRSLPLPASTVTSSTPSTQEPDLLNPRPATYWWPVKVYSDYDDTCQVRLFDHSFPNGTVYPGLRAFLEALRYRDNDADDAQFYAASLASYSARLFPSTSVSTSAAGSAHAAASVEEAAASAQPT
ncbi:MAG: hypothetical protein EOO41_04525, partial [Methanobacteriota archaeon]